MLFGLRVFWSSSDGMTMTAFSAIPRSGVSFDHSLINLVISSMNSLPAFPDGNKKQISPSFYTFFI